MRCVFLFDQILFGCVAQYTIMPALGAVISKFMGLSSALSVGLILLGCCPGGTASNVVRIDQFLLSYFTVEVSILPSMQGMYLFYH